MFPVEGFLFVWLFFSAFASVSSSESQKMKIYFIHVDSALHTLAQFNLQCTLAKLSLIGTSVALLPSPEAGQNLVFQSSSFIKS